MQGMVGHSGQTRKQIPLCFISIDCMCYMYIFISDDHLWSFIEMINLYVWFWSETYITITDCLAYRAHQSKEKEAWKKNRGKYRGGKDHGGGREKENIKESETLD